MSRLGLSVAVVFLAVSGSADAEWKQHVGEAWDATKDAASSAVQKVNDVVFDKDEASSSSGSRETPDVHQERWDDLLDALEEGSEIRIERESLPDKKWFGADKRTKTEQLEKVFRQISYILTDDMLHQYRARVEGASEKIQGIEKDIQSLEEERFGKQGKDRQKLSGRIQAKKDDIARLEVRLDEEKQALLASVREYGLDLTEEQLEVLLLRVDYDDVLELTSTIHAVNRISENLMQLMIESGEDVEAARRYYGMYIVLIELSVFAHNAYLDQIEKDYLPKVEGIIYEADELRAQAKKLKKKEMNPERASAYDSNIRANELTMRAGQTYQEVLRKQQTQLLQSLDRLRKDYDLAENTFRTVRLSADLLSIIAESREEFQALMGLDLPALRPFENKEMERAFEDITTQLKKG